MPGKVPSYQGGPVTYQVSVPVTGGQCITVDAGNAGLVMPTAGTAAEPFLGIATTDGAPPAAPNDGFTAPVVVMPLSNMVAVDDRNQFWILTASAAVSFGQAITTAANGQVKPWATGSRNIGYCAEPLGVAAAGAGLFKISGFSVS
jgi:hypothetical protein